MDKLKMQSPNLVDDNIDKIANIFPNCITETRDEKGNVRRAVDFDLLRQELSHNLVEGLQERYTLNWPGKSEAILTANAPIAKTLRPCEEESVNFDTTQNLFIEGDNLDVLKLLQETYLNKVKMIYIDPPYNTGNDFVYEDDFAEDTDSFLKRSNQKDEEGNRLVVNTDSNGRFHSDWLSMMYPRLKLARNLLKDDGVIFISIDDNEVHNLRKMCDEIFGEKNFIAHIIWQHSIQPKGYNKIFSVHHNHILSFRKSESYVIHPLSRTEKDNKHYSNPDNDPNGPWRTGDVRNALYRPNLIYDISTPSGKIISPPENGWRWSKETIEEKIKTGEIIFSEDEARIIRKIYLANQDGRAPETIWLSDDVGSTREGSAELKDLFDGKVPFDTVKPTRLIKRMIEVAGLKSGDICLDFFAGSSSTAHSLMKHNIANFIMIQLPEPVDEIKPHGKVAKELGIDTIAGIGKERIRRAGKKIKEENPETTQNLDIGFRVFKVDSSNMKDVYYTPDEVKQRQLALFTENIKDDRRPEDLLFQVLLDWGLELTLPVTKEKMIEGKTVFFVDDNVLAACFDTGITEELVKRLARRKPLRAVFRDSSYGSDSVKINVEQIFKLLSPVTEVRTI